MKMEIEIVLCKEDTKKKNIANAIFFVILCLFAFQAIFSIPFEEIAITPFALFTDKAVNLFSTVLPNQSNPW